MARMYSSVWNKLKTASTAKVTVAGDRRATMRQAVKKLKCEENVTRRGLGMLFFGKLQIKEQCIDRERDIWLMEFSLEFNPLIL